LAKYEKEGRVVVANHIQLTTLDGQQALAQQGERKPRVTATNVTNTGRVSTATFDNLGTLVKAQPRVTANDELAMSINVEKSFLGSEAKGLPIFQPTNGPDVRSPSYLSLTAQSTLNLKGGEIVSLAGLQSMPDAVAGSYQVLVFAEVLPEKPAK
jgi:type II secretory pathway component GspD/PulD (secretin)